MTSRFSIIAAAAVLAAAGACGGSKNGATAPTPVANAHLTAPTPVSPGDNEQTSTLRPTLTVQNGTSDQPSGSRTYEFQISDKADFSAMTAITTFAVMVNKTGVAEGSDGRTSFVPETDLQPTTKFYWRARVVQGSSTSDWSATRKFNSKLVGYFRAGEMYDPLIHGETVGDRVGSTEFVAGKGVRLNDATSYVKYLLPATVSDGEFSMEVEGLQGNAPGGKTKVFGMQEGQDDFVTNRYRVDIQYRGTGGSPPNAITWRAMFGSDSERLEPPTDVRFASTFNLNPSRAYFWKATWDHAGFRLVVLDGGMNGSSLYDYGITNERVAYNPNPHYAYLGAPTGRSGAESASIPGTIYRNVWLGSKPRPSSLGTALQ